MKTTTDRSRLGSRLQMARGWYWAFGVNGDPYAMLLCGQDDEPGRWYEQIRSASPALFRSRSGAFVVTGYEAAARVLDGPGFTRAAGETAADWAQPFLDVRTGAGPPLAAVEELVAEYRALLPRPGTRFDLMRDLAREVPVCGLAARLAPGGVAARLAPGGVAARLAPGGVAARLAADAVTARLAPDGEDARRLAPDGEDARALAALLRSSAGALDARLTPQLLAVTEQTLAALAGLRERAGADGVLAGAGCETAANTVCNAVLATLRTPGLAGRLADDPDLADRIVAETLRTAPPVHLECRYATAARTVHGTTLAEGDEVVVAVAAANRDPEAFAAPDRFDVDRPDDPPALTSGLGHQDGLDAFAARHAVAALRALATTLPRMTLAGPLVHRRRSPVLRGISRCPVEI
ncbi:cytochrome P450 [Streptomyces sp. NPDC000410]|uniref:cytochrome P450 n=1 Tax=Streptomyces sp. NPDC000410 TaxID=3154254 RepID=UPI003326DA48